MKQPLNWKKGLMRICWILAGIGLFVLAGAAIQQKNNRLCKEVRIDITGAEQHLFIDEKDVLDLLNANDPVIGRPIAQLSLRQMESLVEQNKWVKNAEMFFNNNQVLQIYIEERQPVARVFQTNGRSFYLDTTAVFLPLSSKLSARVPVFTGFPEQQQPDSALLQQVINMALYIQADSFFSAQISQIDITPNRQFEIVPLVGDQLVRFGDASDLENKFKKLKAFYRSAWLQYGINTYETIDLQFKNQVVGVRRGTAKAFADSASALALIRNTAMFPPSIDSVQAGKKPDSVAVKKTVAKPAATQPATKPADKPVIKPAGTKNTTAKPAVAQPAGKLLKSPKTLMPNNNKKNQKPLRT
ncbi:MAG: cell division protein FtsQ/DivIB [Sediminibacterium sp.]|nr:cell division protein FtsQ/DivIB [Sediminibacterium sp.]